MRWFFLLIPGLLLTACGTSEKDLGEYEEAKTEKEVAAERVETAEDENAELKAQIEAKERELAEAQAAKEAAEAAAAEEETDGD
ncbi:MAG: hypothetical protein A2Y64_02145 [Candidatus Coatesbacteria bacterium RBG_13_66_14]|uniref:Uncharacterized protein n=1 Tax=Candidatus Coatesbacteria bacterium RBG_13_66_14 TaxID=1817816 RepID=A0A1F5FH50_9BACT|nr:MAG: hypothetical protein A2Y64_02145 [Candidatus Coatesbacteria bacterium RBG_13_66_14]